MKRVKSKTIYKPKYENILSRLKQARLDAGLRQEVVGEKLGKYSSYVSKIEHGDRRVDVIELIDMANLYKKDLNFFVDKDIKLKKSSPVRTPSVKVTTRRAPKKSVKAKSKKK